MLPSVLLLLIASAGEPVELAQMSIQQRVIIRVPMARKAKPQPRRDAEDDSEWQEKKGPRCIALRSIRGASVMVDDAVDLILADAQRFRAKLERGCDSVGFYSGFYVEPHADGSLCSGRDELQARSGVSCAINLFRRLVPRDGDD